MLALAVRRGRGPLLAVLALLVLGVGLVFAASSPVVRLAGEASEDYCDQTRASFERTGRLARELAAALESLDAEGVAATAARLTSIRQALEGEAARLAALAHPPGAEDVLLHGAATVGLLLSMADPGLTEAAQTDRDEVATFVRDQFVAARAEARAAAAALRQSEASCPNRRTAQGSFRLLDR